MRASAPLSSSTTSPGSIAEYPPTRGHRPARCFGLRAARIATSTRSRCARRQAVGERARVDGAEVGNGVKGDNQPRGGNRPKVDNGDKVDRSDRSGWERIVCSKPLLFTYDG